MVNKELFIKQLYIMLEKQRLYLLPCLVAQIISFRLNCSVVDMDKILKNEFGVSFVELLWLYRAQFCRKMVADIKKFFIILGYQKHEIS